MAAHGFITQQLGQLVCDAFRHATRIDEYQSATMCANQLYQAVIDFGPLFVTAYGFQVRCRRFDSEIEIGVPSEAQRPGCVARRRVNARPNLVAAAPRARAMPPQSPWVVVVCLHLMCSSWSASCATPVALACGLKSTASHRQASMDSLGSCLLDRPRSSRPRP